MKTLIVIGAYPNTPKKEKVLIDEIESLRGLGYDFMLVSHYPVSTEIQKMVDYYIYEKNQILTPLDKTTYYWFQTDNFMVRVNNSRHALPISQNMFNAFKLSEIKDYDFVFFVENDNQFSLNDSLKLKSLIDEMVSQNKQCIFFKPNNYLDNGSFVYETQMFGITPKYFNEVFKLPTTEDEYFINPDYPVSLELGFYQSLSKHESDFLIVNQHSYEYFSESSINIFRVEELIIELIRNDKNPNLPVLFCHMNKEPLFKHKIIIKLNGDPMEELNLFFGFWFFRSFEISNNILTIEIYKDDVLDEIKSYHLNEQIHDYVNKNGIIEFN
jgi:hypothetical protein